MGSQRPPAPNVSSPLYQRILLSSLRQQGTDVRKFALKFNGAAEGLGYNDAALKDLFNSALEEPLDWWRMRGLYHLMFGEFVEFLGAVPEPAPVREPTESAPRPAPIREPTESAPEPALIREPTESAPEPAPIHEPTESAPEPAPIRESTESAPEPALIREPTESAPEPSPIREPSQSAQEPAP